jgi:hypothetical protein
MTKATGAVSAVQVFGTLPGATYGDPLGLHSLHEEVSSRSRGTVKYTMLESEQFARVVPTHDKREALNAWIARRPPTYSGR